MKAKLTYSQKMDKILELCNLHNIDFKVRLHNASAQDEADRMSGFVSLPFIVPNGDFLDVALKLEDMINDFDVLEIVYGPNNDVIWHMDDDKNDPEIPDSNFADFVKYVENN